MRAATMLETSRRLARRELVLGGFTFLMAVVGLASLAAVAVAGTAGGLDRGGAGGGGGGDGGPSLVAVGRGEASAPAEVATLQLLIGPSGFDDQYIGTTPPEAGAPGDAERAAVQPLVDALQAAGAAPNDVVVHVSPALNQNYFGPSPSVYGIRVDVTVRQPTLEKLNGLVNAAGGAAMEARFSLPQIGVAYGVADCAALRRQARERAIAEARRGAGEQAHLLGKALGPLLLSEDAASGTDADSGSSSANHCASTVPNLAPISAGGGAGERRGRSDLRPCRRVAWITPP